MEGRGGGGGGGGGQPQNKNHSCTGLLNLPVIRYSENPAKRTPLCDPSCVLP